ncbi:MAG: ABC transporter ATP-binding protein [Pseudanabaenaceae cyanobacterium bins.68]|nr:ABC transporter ATP-binding protein [Pseudanabaenaceae cyanobacterium bins.68]
MSPLLEIRGITKSFGDRQILKGIDLQVENNEAIAIIGPSGTGKSTILKIISGLLAPDQGQVWLDGQEATQAGGDGTGVRIGMVFQNAALFDSLNVFENVGFSLFERSRLSRNQICQLVEQNLRLVGLPNIGDRYPSELSGGMRKRVSFARAVIEDPNLVEQTPTKKILLYDEPTAGLDPVASTVIEDLIRNLKDVQQVCDSYLIVTHQDSTIRRTADRVVMLYDGAIQWQGAVSEIDQCDNPYVRQFFSASTQGPIQMLTN